MNLEPTPITDAHIKSQSHTYSPSIDPDFARLLERRLAIATEALKTIKKYGVHAIGSKATDGCCCYGCDTPTIADEALHQMEEVK